LIATAKREIGKVWDDISRAPYKMLFNPSNNAYYVKYVIEIFSKVQDTIRETSAENRRMIQYTIHGNVFIAAQCFKKIDKDNIRTNVYDVNTAIQRIADIAPRIFNEVYTRFEKKYPGSYLAHLFRNANKLKELDAEMNLPGA
jgi:hypothetical protein